MARVFESGKPIMWAVVRTDKDGKPDGWAYGPYDDEAQAKGMRTRAARWNPRALTFEVVPVLLDWGGRG